VLAVLTGMTMFEDGLKSIKADDKVQVMDVAEIVSRDLNEKKSIASGWSWDFLNI